MEALQLLERAMRKPKSWIIFWYSCECHTACPGINAALELTVSEKLLDFFFFSLGKEQLF